MSRLKRVIIPKPAGPHPQIKGFSLLRPKRRNTLFLRKSLRGGKLPIGEREAFFLPISFPLFLKILFKNNKNDMNLHNKNKNCLDN
jgi:hypothetical protein